jgi:hypothetical protein
LSFIDYSTGGNIDGTIAATEANLAATTDKTIIIPGHGKPVSNRRELEEYRDMLIADRDFFVVFAHVEADSGLWAELDGGRLTDLSKEPLIKKYCLGFQKVRTHDNFEVGTR